MTVSEASRRIGISRSKLYQLVAARKITHYRVGGKIIFHEDNLIAFLDASRIAAAQTSVSDILPRLKLKHIRLGQGR
jgi:excisionase family DNA binding protein